MAKGKQRNTLRLDTSAFSDVIAKLEGMGADVKQITSDALSVAAEKIARDTKIAIQPENLPAKGKYSRHPSKTAESIITTTEVTWEGLTAWVPVGFDFAKPGAGGYLISGTPRMKPDRELNRMYKQKAYMGKVKAEISEVFYKHLAGEWEKKQ